MSVAMRALTPNPKEPSAIDDGKIPSLVTESSVLSPRGGR
jgi:hypothetical protein